MLICASSWVGIMADQISSDPLGSDEPINSVASHRCRDTLRLSTSHLTTSSSTSRSSSQTRMSATADASPPVQGRLSRSSSESETPVKDLTEQLEEVDPHPSACGGFSDVYKYRYRDTPGPVLVAVKSLRVYNGFEVLVQETLKVSTQHLCE